MPKSRALKQSMRLGGGGKFQSLANKLESKGKSAGSANAIAASIGIKKYGKPKMMAMAKAGRKS